MPNPLRSTSRFLLPLSAVVLALAPTACSDLPLALDIAEISLPPSGGSADRVRTGNPVEGLRLYVDPRSAARKKVDEWRHSRPAEAALLEKIASQPQAFWVGDWNTAPAAVVRNLVDRVTAVGALPVLALYNVPLRDCGQHSAGGAAGAAEYQRWISEVARGIGGRRAVVILEPDALAGMDCLSAARQQERVDLLARAVRTLKSGTGALVYLDAGNATWHSAEAIAARLRRAGVGEADGFALNVSQYIATGPSVSYGEQVSRHTGGKHFVLDTGRNGRGAAPDGEWCNAPGRALGARPTTSTGHPLVDALLWIKNPGESDGRCNGGPSAGAWWAEYAVGLARRADW